MSDSPPPRLRVDKWLWHARFFKTRGLAGEIAQSGRLRINGRHCTKAAQTVTPGDTLSFAQGARVRAIRVEAIGTRRGPAGEAQALFTDLDPAPAPSAPPGSAPEAATEPALSAAPQAGKKPTRRERAQLAALRRQS
ncbi:MAG: RNA-binding S4 domain-containing protein [Pseudomonadota bacterium]